MSVVICAYKARNGGETVNIDAIKIEILLGERNMTKTDLAARCGVSRQNISTIVRRGTCAPKTAVKLANGLGGSVADIIEKGD
jgi:DNA-binding Xre family transcriptional regulator